MFLIHDDVKWVRVLGCDVELALDVGGGGTLGEKFAPLNNHRAAPANSASCSRLTNLYLPEATANFTVVITINTYCNIV